MKENLVKILEEYGEIVEPVPLHVHTQYSLLDGYAVIKKLAQRCSDLKVKGCAITDHGHMLGVVDFYREMNGIGIKPIIGFEAYAVKDIHDKDIRKEEIEANKKKKGKDKDESIPGTIKAYYNKLAEENEDYYAYSRISEKEAEDEDGDFITIQEIKYSIAHLVVLAKDNEGYKNLMRLASRAQLEGFYSKPSIDFNMLKDHHEGLIVLSACRGGEIPKLILRGREDLAIKKSLEYKELFGEDFYFEIQPSHLKSQIIVNEALLRLGKELGIETVVTTDAHYILKEDSKAHKILLKVSTGNDDFEFEEDTNYVMTTEELICEYDIPYETILNTHKILDKCNVELDYENLYPKVEAPSGYTFREWIEHKCRVGLYDRYRQMSKEKQEMFDWNEYLERLEFELNVIDQKGYIDYFLINSDWIGWAKENDILIGPGRGSAAGSIISWCLRITEIDPIEHDLLFERFLSLERMSPPDIDTDIEEYIDEPELFKSGRQRVIEYLQSKYGEDHMCQILALGTMGTKSVLKDVARSLSNTAEAEGREDDKIDHNEITAVNKKIPNDYSLMDALHGDGEKGKTPIKEVIELQQKYPELIDVALSFQGLPKNTSIHAAGVVITPKPVTDLIPLNRGGDGETVSQFDKVLVEDLGLLKLDLLGLRTLGVINRAIKMIKKRHGVDIDFYNIPHNDPKVMELIASGNTDGVFQIESPGMKQMFMSMNKVQFEDIVAGLSLYRPGPMAYIPTYVARANGEQEVQYLFPELEPILSKTYGVLVYQEQLMRASVDLAGFTKGQSDDLRSAVGKKKVDKIKVLFHEMVYGNEEKNIPGMIKNGISEELCLKFLEQVEEFGKYAFNKSHSVCYAELTNVTAWFKCYYAEEFMAALISSYIGKDDDKIRKYIDNCRKMGIRILPPDINKSEYEFTLEDNQIRFGLGAIKGLSKTAVLVMKERELNGEYSSISEFLSRFDKKSINKKSLEVLCLGGCLNSLEPNGDRYDILKLAFAIRDDIGYPVYTEVTDEVDQMMLARLGPKKWKKWHSECIVHDEKRDGNYSFIDKTIETIDDFKKLKKEQKANFVDHDEVIDKLLKEDDKVKKPKNIYSKALQEDFRIIQLEMALLGTYLSKHPLDGKAEAIDWDNQSLGSLFDVTCIINNVKEIQTKRGQAMAFVDAETLEGDKSFTVFPSEYSKFGEKLEIGGVRVMTLEVNLNRQSGEIGYIVKNVKYFR